RERHDIAIARRRVCDPRGRIDLRTPKQRRKECGGVLCFPIKPEMRHNLLHVDSSPANSSRVLSGAPSGLAAAAAVGSRDDLQHMSARILEIDAASAVM